MHAHPSIDIFINFLYLCVCVSNMIFYSVKMFTIFSVAEKPTTTNVLAAVVTENLF